MEDKDTPRKIFLQGLVGLGFVGYNTIKTLVDSLEAEVLQDYAEFFPNLSLIDDGAIENQCCRVYHKTYEERDYYLLNGPQPRSDELASLFLQKFISDYRTLEEGSGPVDLYISFGAFVTSMLTPEEMELGLDLKVATPEDIAEAVLKYEVEKPRRLFVATCGPLGFDTVATMAGDAEQVVKETQGYISGLNGVLPALIGERLKTPTATIMVETTLTEAGRMSSQSAPALTQFLGLVSTKRALEFLRQAFGLDLQLDEKVAKLIEEIQPHAKEDLLTGLTFGEAEQEKERTENDFRDKMYI